MRLPGFPPVVYSLIRSSSANSPAALNSSTSLPPFFSQHRYPPLSPLASNSNSIASFCALPSRRLQCLAPETSKTVPPAARRRRAEDQEVCLPSPWLSLVHAACCLLTIPPSSSHRYRLQTATPKGLAVCPPPPPPPPSNPIALYTVHP